MIHPTDWPFIVKYWIFWLVVGVLAALWEHFTYDREHIKFPDRYYRR